MTDKLYENLKEMYDSFFNEKQNLKNSMEINICSINKIDYFLDSLSEKEDIKSKWEEKKKLENENQYYKEKIDLLDNRINTLSLVLNCIEKSSEKEGVNKKLYVLDIQEKERQRIARDLHDTSLQNLAHLVHKIELSSMYIDNDPVKAKLELLTVNKSLKSIIQEIRNTVFDLRPMSFDDLGLKDSFERLIIRLKENSDLDIQSDIDDIKNTNSLILMTIFRIVEECLNNAVKHSQGKNIIFSLKNKNNICKIIIKDDGKGFNYNEVRSVKERHFGLTILKERIELLSGDLVIESEPNKGTAINIEIPLSNN